MKRNSHIGRACNKNKIRHGFIWEFLKDDEILNMFASEVFIYDL